MNKLNNAIAVTCGVFACSTNAQVVIEQGFDTSPTGWGIYGDANPLTWQALLGNPGGCIQAVDRNAGQIWGFTSGPEFHGDRSCMYGGQLSFNMRVSHIGTSGATSPDVTLIGNGLTLVYDLPVPPAVTWVSHTLPLTEAGWKHTTLTGAAATAAEFQAVLSNLTQIQFRQEFSSSVDTGRLDNVKMVAFALETLADTSVCAGLDTSLSANVVVGQLPSNVTYQWRRNGVAIESIDNPSATLQTLVISQAQESDEGLYDCVVTIACGSATTTAALLTVCACLECPADFNLDGGVDGSDVTVFFDQWSIGDCDADVNQDGGVDGADVSYFFDAWVNGGC